MWGETARTDRRKVARQPGIHCPSFAAARQAQSTTDPFDATAQDPRHTNALASSLWELQVRCACGTARGERGTRAELGPGT